MPYTQNCYTSHNYTRVYYQSHLSNLHDLPRCSTGSTRDAHRNSEKFSLTISTPQKQNKTKQKIFHATSAKGVYKRCWAKCREPVWVCVVDDKWGKLPVGIIGEPIQLFPRRP